MPKRKGFTIKITNGKVDAKGPGAARAALNLLGVASKKCPACDTLNLAEVGKPLADTCKECGGPLG